MSNSETSRPPSPDKTLSHSDLDIHRLYQEQKDIPSKEETISRRQKRQRRSQSDDSTDSDPDLRQIMREFMTTQTARLDKLEQHILELIQHSANLAKTNTDIEKSLNQMSDQITSIETKIDSLEKDKKSIASQLIQIDERMDNFDRQLIKASIEIRNIPKSLIDSKEHQYRVVTDLANSLGLNLSNVDIRDVCRLPSKRENLTAALSVDFNNTLTKSLFLQYVKDYNKKKTNAEDKLNSTHIYYTGEKAPIYVSECLTSHAKQLYYVTRKFVKQNNYAYCWTSEGNILIRKDSKSPYIIIKNEAQLQQL